jgi:hypothetical protein
MYAQLPMRRATAGFSRISMDYYANQSLGPWTPNHVNPEEDKRQFKARKAKLTAWKSRKQQQRQTLNL